MWYVVLQYTRYDIFLPTSGLTGTQDWLFVMKNNQCCVGASLLWKMDPIRIAIRVYFTLSNSYDYSLINIILYIFTLSLSFYSTFKFIISHFVALTIDYIVSRSICISFELRQLAHGIFHSPPTSGKNPNFNKSKTVYLTLFIMQTIFIICFYIFGYLLFFTNI